MPPTRASPLRPVLLIYIPSVKIPLASIMRTGLSGTQRMKYQLEVVISGSLGGQGPDQGLWGLRRLSPMQSPFQLQHNIVLGRTSKMLKGQEGNTLPFVITCCSSSVLVEWGTRGGFGQSPPSRVA